MTELGIAVAFADVAEDLVVGAVLFDDEEDVLDAERGEVAIRRPAVRIWGCWRRSLRGCPAASCAGSGAGILSSEPSYCGS